MYFNYSCFVLSLLPVPVSTRTRDVDLYSSAWLSLKTKSESLVPSALTVRSLVLALSFRIELSRGVDGARFYHPDVCCSPSLLYYCHLPPLPVLCLHIGTSPVWWQQHFIFIYACKHVCIGWNMTGAYYTARLTFSHGSSIKVWGAYYIQIFTVNAMSRFVLGTLTMYTTSWTTWPNSRRLPTKSATPSQILSVFSRMLMRSVCKSASVCCGLSCCILFWKCFSVVERMGFSLQLRKLYVK